jgi:hypothetical protein
MQQHNSTGGGGQGGLSAPLPYRSSKCMCVLLMYLLHNVAAQQYWWRGSRGAVSPPALQVDVILHTYAIYVFVLGRAREAKTSNHQWLMITPPSRLPRGLPAAKLQSAPDKVPRPNYLYVILCRLVDCDSCILVAVPRPRGYCLRNSACPDRAAGRNCILP